MNDRIAKPANESYGTVDGVKITEEVVARLVKNAEDGFPDAKYRAPNRSAEPTNPHTRSQFGLSESELSALMKCVQRKRRSPPGLSARHCLSGRTRQHGAELAKKSHHTG